MKNQRSFMTLLVMLLVSPAALAQSSAELAATPLSQRIEQLRREVLDLNRDLSLLEEELLYPSSQTAVFLSVDVGTPIRLVDVNLTLNGQHVGYHFYSDEEFSALTKGGIQRLYTGNLRSGRNQLEAIITGYDPRGKDYQRTASYTFEKGPGRKWIELRVVDDLDAMQHRFEFHEWDQ
ncbi:MAG: hypothetical protein LAT61_06170 [Alcanivorax sp.]|nr:hypothetical protein [Alcanivorax sp.]